MDLSTLEICKDSFIEKDLSDYYSDMLYRVKFRDGSAGSVYVLFEHKNYYDKYVHLQLLEYMIKIWRLHIKQNKKKPAGLPVVIPLLICHGRREWPENTVGRSRGAAEKAKVVYNSYLCPNQDTIIFKGVYHEKVRINKVQQAL